MRRLLNFILCFVILIASSCRIVTPRIASVNTAFDSIVIEIQPTTRFYPRSNDVDGLVHHLANLSICKKENIIVIVKDRLNISRSEWSREQVVQFEKDNRIIANSSKRRISIFISYLPGTYSEDGLLTILGLQYGYKNSIAMFKTRTWEDKAGVLLHEILHVIGLVSRDNRHAPPVRTDRPNHCNNEKCIMYFGLGYYEIWLCPNCISEIRRFITNNE